ncbi:hypothetical protein GOC83_08175 [Haloarcula rubripromontorii]|uniref:Uncharacterized protein n=1 Tax=Haloarcula rubripromontorii TaxID=1705562 RepID=A0A847TSI8_9EURY|nr:hypothetical protein [Haloarcula rubripromontorii]NLV06103.1 hypothetical protein [Haloarcula rubripromontorii]
MSPKRDLAQPTDWPFARDEFVRASRLLEATDDDVRRAIGQVEDGDRR